MAKFRGQELLVAHPGRIAYVPALDGLRGLAVAAVLLYHADVSWMRGGFLGVDAFFVLSGYLITSLLLAERRDSGAIDLAAFWGRRARRLLPALFLVLGFVAIYSVAFAEPGQIPKIRGDALATLGYVANWHQIFSGESYFDQFSGPSPLRHTWSLAIEEQWYLLWPIAVLMLLRLRRGSKWALGATIAALAVGSAVLMALLYEPGTDPSRPYYGTDTRVQSLLVGAGLALLITGRAPVTGTYPRMFMQAFALCCAGFVAWLWVTSAESSEFLYRGGLIASAIAVAVVIASARDERSLTGRALALPPLMWLGLISYGVYLWHWPLYLTLTEQRTGLDGNALLLVRLAATLGVAAASYYIIEMPVRRGVLPTRVSWAAAPATAALLAVALVLTTRGGGPAVDFPSANLEAGRAEAARQAILFDHPDPATATTTATVPPAATHTMMSAIATVDHGTVILASLSTSTPKPPPPPRATRAPPLQVLLVGDSVASTLPQGLYPYEQQYNFRLDDVSIIGCSMIRGDIQLRDGTFASPDTNAECRQREQLWRNAIAGQNPQIVLVLPGLWDAHNHRVKGQVLEFGTSAARSYWLSELRRVVDVLGSGGARVVFMTSPLFPPEAYTGPDRINELNRLVRQVASERAGRVSVIDLNGFLYPSGRFVSHINGINVRGDGYHFSLEGAVYVGRWISQQLANYAN